MSKKNYYSAFRRPVELQSAMMSLFVEQTPNLLASIYESVQGTDKAPDSEIRVGLALKILHNTPKATRFPLEVIEPIVRDIESMIRDHDYLRSTEQPRLRLRCLRNELDLVQSYIDLNETVSLNCEPSELTFKDSQLPKDDVPTPSEHESNKEEQSDPVDECVVM